MQMVCADISREGFAPFYSRLENRNKNLLGMLIRSTQWKIDPWSILRKALLLVLRLILISLFGALVTLLALAVITVSQDLYAF